VSTEAKVARAVFDLIEAHQMRREPIVLAHVEAVVREAMRQPVLVGVDLASEPDKTVWWYIGGRGGGKSDFIQRYQHAVAVATDHPEWVKPLWRNPGV